MFTPLKKKIKKKPKHIKNFKILGVWKRIIINFITELEIFWHLLRPSTAIQTI